MDGPTNFIPQVGSLGSQNRNPMPGDHFCQARDSLCQTLCWLPVPRDSLVHFDPFSNVIFKDVLSCSKSEGSLQFGK